MKTSETAFESCTPTHDAAVPKPNRPKYNSMPAVAHTTNKQCTQPHNQLLDTKPLGQPNQLNKGIVRDLCLTGTLTGGIFKPFSLTEVYISSQPATVVRVLCLSSIPTLSKPPFKSPPSLSVPPHLHLTLHSVETLMLQLQATSTPSLASQGTPWPRVFKGCRCGGGRNSHRRPCPSLSQTSPLT